MPLSSKIRLEPQIPWDSRELGKGLKEFLKDKPTHLLILDSGCSLGTDSIEMSKIGYKVTGLDISKEQLAIAQKRAQMEGVTPLFVLGDVHHLPFDDDSFDLVIDYFGAFEESKKKEKCLKELKRVLRSKGLLYLAVKKRKIGSFNVLAFNKLFSIKKQEETERSLSIIAAK